MRKYYVIKVNRNTDKPELLEVMEMNNLKEARTSASRKYTSYITDINVGLSVVGQDGYNKFWREKIEAVDNRVEENEEVKNERYALNNMTVNELRAMAKELHIKGLSRAKKTELVEAILNSKEATPAFTATISKVNMYAFTGMFIGEFEAEVQDGKILVSTASRGELIFDLNTGKELCEESKARWANRVEAV